MNDSKIIINFAFSSSFRCMSSGFLYIYKAFFTKNRPYISVFPLNQKGGELTLQAGKHGENRKPSQKIIIRC